MGYGLTNHLLALAGLIFVAGSVIASRRLPLWCALAVAFVRVCIPLLYFAWYFDGQWTFLDDLSYAEHGEYLIDTGMTPLDILTTDGRHQLHALTGSRHILYSWWNLTTMWLCGTYYYVPVLANVLVTFGTAHLLARLLEELGFSRGYQQVLQVYYLLHWDTIAWSSIVNVKDALVQLMTLGLFLYATRMVRRRSWCDVGWCFGLFFVFQYMRFYVPFIIGAAAGGWVFLQWRDIRKYPLLAGGLVVGLWMMPGHVQQFFDSFSPFEIIYGIGRFTLTPQPWNISDNYSFLVFPATFHWLMIVPAAAGGVMLWRDSPPVRLVLLYALIMIVMYALADEIQGVRQRVQISFVFAWAQMHFLWRWMHTPATRTATAARLKPGVPIRVATVQTS